MLSTLLIYTFYNGRISHCVLYTLWPCRFLIFKFWLFMVLWFLWSVYFFRWDIEITSNMALLNTDMNYCLIVAFVLYSCVCVCVRRTPEQCPSVVSLLSESYNPHVRYGAAMALGICCAGTGYKVSFLVQRPSFCSFFFPGWKKCDDLSLKLFAYFVHML